MDNLSPHYPAKLLLFGEYTVLNGSQALAIPLNQWHGRWVQQKDTKHADEALFAYVAWMQSNEIIEASIAANIMDDANHGWHYEADIPIGFGLGSSGAFVAALYDRYIARADQTTVSSHDILRKMEGFFHGSSSGMDPLVSFSGKALYKSEKNDLQIISDPGWPEGYNLFLLDTGVTRSTSSLVQTYREMLDNDNFKIKIERQLIPMVEHAIHFYLSGAGTKLEECISVISEFQRNYFSSFIPDRTKIQWDALIKKPGVFVKFCGAGGGGYFLVVSTPIFNDELPANVIPIQLPSARLK